MGKIKVLVICAKGLNRSKYLASYLKKEGYSTRYGGVESYDKEPGKAPNQIKKEDIEWTDIIIITRKRLKEILKDLFEIKDKKILVFNIPDLTSSGKFEKTEELLRKAIKPYLPLKK